MLKVYVAFDNENIPSNIERVDDVETDFLTVKLNGTNSEKALIKEIEQGEYLDELHIIDRFGDKLRTDDISTGCKAGLCVIHHPNKLINLIEIGINAVSSILRHCTDGNIIIHEWHMRDIETWGDNIQVQVGNYWFDNMQRLRNYIYEEWPYEPYMTGGVHRV